MIRTIALALVLAACGGKSSTPAPAPHTEAEGEHHEMEKMPPELVKFHDVLAPRWHAAKGPQRMTDTCAAIPDFKAAIVGIASAVPPAGTDATEWNNGTAELSQAVDGLDKTCQAHDAAAFEDAFLKVHQGFHHLMGEH